MLTTFQGSVPLWTVSIGWREIKMTWPEGTLPSSEVERVLFHLMGHETCLYYFVAFRNALVLLSKIWKVNSNFLTAPNIKNYQPVWKRVNDFFFKKQKLYLNLFSKSSSTSEVLILPNSSLKLLHLKFYLPIFICLLYWVPHVTFSLKFGWHKSQRTSKNIHLQSFFFFTLKAAIEVSLALESVLMAMFFRVRFSLFCLPVSVCLSHCHSMNFWNYASV